LARSIYSGWGFLRDCVVPYNSYKGSEVSDDLFYIGHHPSYNFISRRSAGRTQGLSAVDNIPCVFLGVF